MLPVHSYILTPDACKIRTQVLLACMGTALQQQRCHMLLSNMAGATVLTPCRALSIPGVG